MRKNTFIPLCIAAALTIGLTGCSGTKEKLGLTRKAPDEFAVVKRAPLTLPPNYNLRPPEPGAPRPQEQATAAQARQTVFGDQGEQKQPQETSAEEIFLQEAGADKASDDIRQVVDEESKTAEDKNKPVAKKLLGLAGGDDEPTAQLVDPAKESERLRKNAEEGKPVTEGETPYLEQ